MTQNKAFFGRQSKIFCLLFIYLFYQVHYVFYLIFIESKACCNRDINIFCFADTLGFFKNGGQNPRLGVAAPQYRSRGTTMQHLIAHIHARDRDQAMQCLLVRNTHVETETWRCSASYAHLQGIQHHNHISYCIKTLS